MSKDFLKKIDYSKLQPVDSQLLSFSASQNLAAQKIILDHALTFTASDLLGLSNKQIMIISDKLRGQFASIAAGKRVSFDRRDLQSLVDTDTNALLHELEHLRIIALLRPELLDDATVNILAVLDNMVLKMAMNVMTPIPQIDYSPTERAQIMMAPSSPSDQDYVDLYNFIRSHSVAPDEITYIRELVSTKKDGLAKTEMLKFLSTLNLNT